MKKLILPVLFIFILPLFLVSCASPYLKGMSEGGEKVYLNTDAIEKTKAFSLYLKSDQDERAKIVYLFRRILKSDQLNYYHDDNLYSAQDTYKAGLWLLDNRYEEGQSAREFAKDQVLVDEASGKPNYVKLPDGTIHIGYYLLINELDLLEEKTAPIK